MGTLVAIILILLIALIMVRVCLVFSSRRRHTRSLCDWSSDVCSSDLTDLVGGPGPVVGEVIGLGYRHRAVTHVDGDRSGLCIDDQALYRLGNFVRLFLSLGVCTRATGKSGQGEHAHGDGAGSSNPHGRTSLERWLVKPVSRELCRQFRNSDQFQPAGLPGTNGLRFGRLRDRAAP